MRKTIYLEELDWIAELDVEYEIKTIKTDTLRGVRFEEDVEIKSIDGTITFYDENYKCIDIKQYDDCPDLKHKLLEKAFDDLELEKSI
jgi:hypothetical protein